MSDLIVACRKCGHEVYVSAPILEKVSSLIVYDCPACGEEGDRNWIITGSGEFDG